jgi:hypothetical protein
MNEESALMILQTTKACSGPRFWGREINAKIQFFITRTYCRWINCKTRKDDEEIPPWYRFGVVISLETTINAFFRPPTEQLLGKVSLLEQWGNYKIDVGILNVENITLMNFSWRNFTRNSRTNREQILMNFSRNTNKYRMS